MKAIMLSINQNDCELIARGKNTFVGVKTCPKLGQPFKCYICGEILFEKDKIGSVIDMFCKTRKKVIGEFVCDEVIYVRLLRGKSHYGLHISDLVIYDKPKELGEFIKSCKFEDKEWICNFFCPYCESHGTYFYCKRFLTKPPQSWCYVEDLGERL